MPKRKANGDGNLPSNTKMDVDGAEEDSDDDASIINVDFEWFDPDPEVDFHGLKTLLRQLLDVDNESIDLSALTDLILSSPPAIGSTVKCDGKESDPYAFLVVLDLHRHRGKEVAKQVTEYLLQRTAGNENMKSVGELLAPNSTARLGLVLAERLINMPHQIVPPLYQMMLDEVKAAGASDAFTHYLLISKTYTEVASMLDTEDDRPAKKKKAGAKTASTETFYFHPEDEVLQKHALAHCTFEYAKQGDEGASDSKRAFQELGVRPQGSLILIEASNMDRAVSAVAEYLGADS